MYLISNEFTVGPARFSDYMAWSSKLSDWLKKQKGFMRRTLATSYSYPSKYLGGWRFDSREAALAALTGAAWADFQRANPTDGVLTLTRPTEAYEEVFSTGDRSPSYKFLMASEWFLDTGKATTFENSRKEFFALRQKQAGTGFAVLWRLMGSPFKYVAANFFPDLDSGRASIANPAVAEYLRAHPYTEYASVRPVIDSWEVLRLEMQA